jgi:hypothetical protein
MDGPRKKELTRWVSLGVLIAILFILGQNAFHHGNFNFFMGILILLSFSVATLSWFLREQRKERREL